TRQVAAGRAGKPVARRRLTRPRGAGGESMKRLKVAAVLAAAAVVGIGASASARQDDSLVSRILKLAQPRAQSGTLRASYADTSIGAVNPSGVVVAVMGADDFGDGVLGVLDKAGVPRAGMAVDATGAGQVGARSTSGLTQFLMDGNLGFISGPADMAEMF